jgi:hypothetical protein
MKSKTILQSLTASLAVLLLGSVPSAWAQSVTPVPPTLAGSIPQSLHGCTAEVLNVSGFVGTDGVVSVSNIPTTQGQARLRVTCLNAQNQNVTCVSAYFTPVAGVASSMGSITCGGGLTIPTTLTASYSTNATITTNSVQPGNTAQLYAFGNIAGPPANPHADVTAASTGTSYRSSNTAVATISADGLVTAVSPGTALLTALHEGTLGFASLTVLPAGLDAIAITPKPTGGLKLDLPKIFQSVPIQLKVTGAFGNQTTLDLSGASTGTTYSSDNPGSAQVTANGLVIPVSPGTATITATSGGKTDTVDVTVAQFVPFASAAYPAGAGGYAYNVDIAGTLVYVANGGLGLSVYDTGAGGAVVAGKSFTGASAYDVRVNGDLAAVALGTAGVALLNIKDNVMTEYYRLTPGGDVRDVWLSGNTLYCANGSAFFTYDVSNPAAWTAAPTSVGLPIANARAVSADATRDLAVVLSGTSPPTLTVIQSGAVVGSVTLVPPAGTSGAGEDVVLFGTSAYTASGRSGIQRVDLTDVAHPIQKGNADPGNPTDAHGVAVRGTPKGVLVAVGDDLYYNSVPLLNATLNNFYDIEVCKSGVTCSLPGGGPVQADANGTGIALGDGFGVQAAGPSGIQVFRTAPLVDNAGIAPKVWITSPTVGAQVPLNRAVRVTLGASDDVGLATVQVFINGNPILTKPTSPYSASYVPTAEGPLTITAQATDLGGNVGNSSPVTIEVIAPVAGAIPNFGFETGDTSDWDVIDNFGGAVSVVPRVDPGLGTTQFPDPYLPQYGSYFALIQSGCPGVPNGLSRSLTLTAGQVIEGYAAFLGGDYHPFDDFGVVMLTPGGELFRRSLGMYAQNYGYSQWEHWSFTAPADGVYDIAYESENTLDCALPSFIIVDSPDVLQ